MKNRKVLDIFKKRWVKTFIAILILLLLVVIIGESYAYFKVTILGERTYSVTVKNLNLTLDESTTPDDIILENMAPKPDSEGVKQEPYTFTLTNNNSVQVGFAIFLDDLPIPNEVNRISDAKIRYQLIKNGVETIGTLSELGTYPLRIMDIGKMDAKESNQYSLRFWIDENAGDEIKGQAFSVRLRVVVTQPEVIDSGELEKGTAVITTENGVIETTIVDLNNLVDKSMESIVDQKVEEELLNVGTKILDKAYPIGSIYISEDSTNPTELFGGVWEKYSEGRTLVGVSEDKEEYKTAGLTGGNENVSNIDIAHTHNYDKTSAATYNTVVAHTHNYDKATSATYNTVISHSHNYSKTTAAKYSTVIAHTHSGTSLVAAIGAVNDNPSSIAYMITSAPAGLPVGSGAAYMFGHGNGNYFGSSSITKWNHGTKVYGNTASKGSSSGALSLTQTTTATTTVGSSSGAMSLGHTSTATASTGSATGSVSLANETVSTTGMNESVSLNAQDPYITVYMWQRME